MRQGNQFCGLLPAFLSSEYKTSNSVPRAAVYRAWERMHPFALPSPFLRQPLSWGSVKCSTPGSRGPLAGSSQWAQRTSFKSSSMCLVSRLPTLTHPSSPPGNSVSSFWKLLHVEIAAVHGLTKLQSFMPSLPCKTSSSPP